MDIIIMAPKGKMGKLITKIANDMENVNIAAAIAPKGRDYIGTDAGLAAGIGELTGALVYDDLEQVIDKGDVIIDCSNPTLSMEVMESALRHKKAVVCGTTGFAEEQMNRIREIAEQIPVVFAGNTSMVVNLMYNLLKITTETIGEISDIEIIEMHDRNKKDAPSGTSKEIGEVIAEALGKKLKDIAVFGREGAGARIPGSIGYHSLRAGDISSSHTVMFGLMGERLELTHHAHNWQCFANGACQAAVFLYGKAPGFYTMKDVLGLKD